MDLNILYVSHFFTRLKFCQLFPFLEQHLLPSQHIPLERKIIIITIITITYNRLFKAILASYQKLPYSDATTNCLHYTSIVLLKNAKHNPYGFTVKGEFTVNLQVNKLTSEVGDRFLMVFKRILFNG